jgi:hypothetical protein
MNAVFPGKKRALWILTVSILVSSACAQKATQKLNKPVETLIALNCGEAPIELHCYTASLDSEFIFINVHEDEQTSIEALGLFSVENPINYCYLHHQGTRRIFFNLGDTTYNIDPNRMFTDTGRKKTLEDGGVWSEDAQVEVAHFSENLLEQVKKSRVIVALHNNTPENYSIQSYMPDSSEAKNTAALYINPEMDPDDFIYTTDQAFFDYFQQQGVNVILQDNTRFVDDGSLSVYCGMNGLRYVNIETEHGHLEAQVHLLQLLLASGEKK